jgi:hypothetical protein
MALTSTLFDQPVAARSLPPVMAIETATRPFSFSFADLAVVPETPDLTVLESEAAGTPGDVREVEPAPRPRWLSRLLPVFRAGDPLRIQIRASAAPAFGARLADSLGRLFATAGAEAGIRVGAWEGGFGVGGHGMRRMTAEPHAHLVVAELEQASVGTALAALDEIPAAACWLVLHGDLPALDPVLGVERAMRWVPPERVVRLPLFERGDLAAAVRGVAPGLGRQRTGRAYLELGTRLVRAYLEAQL